MVVDHLDLSSSERVAIGLWSFIGMSLLGIPALTLIDGISGPWLLQAHRGDPISRFSLDPSRRILEASQGWGRAMRPMVFTLVLVAVIFPSLTRGGGHSDLERALGKDLDDAVFENVKVWRLGLRPVDDSDIPVDFLVCKFRAYVRVTADEAEKISHRASLALIGHAGVFTFPDGSRYKWSNVTSFFLAVTKPGDDSKMWFAPCPWVRDECESSSCTGLLPKK